ncbi:MAG: hypothetical protein HY263_03880 [Chloroflexi bacterium]|nr:hypothetical protein [Chloroflexota bacterium]
MRRLAALAAALIIATIAGCGGASNKDPYELVYAASKAAASDVVQVRVGLRVQGATPIEISPDAFKLTVDSKTKTFRLQVELPIASLGIPAAQLQAFGVTGDSISADLLYDGNGIYLNSPVAAKVLSILMTQFDQTPPANLGGWLRLGTAAEFAALAGQLGAMPSIAPAATAPTITDGASLKSQLEPNGISLTYVETVTRNGASANHVSVAFDWAKLATNPAFKSVSAAQAAQLAMLEGQADVSVDLWLDASTSKLLEIGATVAQKSGTASGTPEKVEIVVLIGAPDATTTLDAPATYTEVPLTPLIRALVEQFAKGMFPTP